MVIRMWTFQAALGNGLAVLSVSRKQLSELWEGHIRIWQLGAFAH